MRRLVELQQLRLPTAALITAIGTAVEVHVSRVLENLVRTTNIKSSALGTALLDDAGPSMTKSWDSRADWLKAGFSIEYRGDSAYQDFKVLVKLRNTIVHGDGELSDLQSRSTIKDLAKMRKEFAERLEVALNERAQFGPNTSAKALRIAREFVRDFDVQVVSKYPSVWML